jgi:hypothetical protein
MYASSQYVNIIGISQKLMRTIYFQAILVYLNPLNGILQSKVEKQCSKPFVNGNIADKLLPTRTLLYVSVRHIFISLTNFLGIYFLPTVSKYFPKHPVLKHP